MPPRSSIRRRDPLNRKAIVGAAIRILDIDGLDGFTMRRVAEALGTGPASLYWHVGSKDGLSLTGFTSDPLVSDLDRPFCHTHAPPDDRGQSCRLRPPDPRTGHRRWTGRTFLYAGYADAELGYAVTDHAAQGRTVAAGLAVITGTEDRRHAYVALTRGTDTNHAYVFTISPKQADPVPGPRSAPELARYDKISAERAGFPAPATPPAPAGTALGVLAAVLDRDGQQHSATQTATRPSPTPTTSRSCTRSGPPRPPRPASSATGTC